MQVFDVLKQNSQIFGKKIIEASAGTGKTFAIEHLIVRLLLEKENPLTIDQILVVTFTKAATKELRFRIRGTLQKALLFLKKRLKEESIFSYLIPFIEKEDKISKLQNAIDLFETAQIFTIHSFCFKALKEFAFEADILLDIDED
nr:RecBCD enzyme subunit RecB [Candidatus Anoxychlamydiales bacterium]